MQPSAPTMDWFARLLVLSGDAVRAAGRTILDALSWLWSLIDSLLQPVLSPVLAFLNPLITSAADLFYGLLDPLPAWAGLTIISILAGIIMLIAFKYLSNQKGIARAKDDIKAQLLALKLFKDDLGVTFRCQWRLLKAIVRLQRYVLTPVLILLFPMLLALAQMGVRYQWRPYQIGETILLTAHETMPDVQSDESGQLMSNRSNAAPLTLGTPSEVKVEVNGITGGGKTVWRIRAKQVGTFELTLQRDGGPEIKKQLVVADRLERVSPIRPGSSWTRQLLYPNEPPLPAVTGLSTIELNYPFREHWFYGADWWVLSFFVVSMLAALLLKPLFGVKF